MSWLKQAAVSAIAMLAIASGEGTESQARVDAKTMPFIGPLEDDSDPVSETTNDTWQDGTTQSSQVVTAADRAMLANFDDATESFKDSVLDAAESERIASSPNSVELDRELAEIDMRYVIERARLQNPQSNMDVATTFVRTISRFRQPAKSLDDGKAGEENKSNTSNPETGTSEASSSQNNNDSASPDGDDAPGEETKSNTGPENPESNTPNPKTGTGEASSAQSNNSSSSASPGGDETSQTPNATNNSGNPRDVEDNTKLPEVEVNENATSDSGNFPSNSTLALGTAVALTAAAFAVAKGTKDAAGSTAKGREKSKKPVPKQAPKQIRPLITALRKLIGTPEWIGTFSKVIVLSVIDKLLTDKSSQESSQKILPEGFPAKEYPALIAMRLFYAE